MTRPAKDRLARPLPTRLLGTHGLARELVTRRCLLRGLALAPAVGALTPSALAGPTTPAAADDAPSASPGTGPELRERTLQVPGAPRLARQALLLTPVELPDDTPAPLLVLLHGLGETDSEAHGLRAWADLYGLKSAHERLAQPPLSSLRDKRPYLTAERASTLNGWLKIRPYRPVRMLCPFTPNVYKMPTVQALNGYADWLADDLLKRARSLVRTSAVGLDGCSLGGFIVLEVFRRRPFAFQTLGVLQAAFHRNRARLYARQLHAALLRTGPRPLHIESSSYDVYRKSNEALARELRQLGVPLELCVPPGPHDQPFLRDVGTLEMLLWHSRQLHGWHQATTPGRAPHR